MEINEMYNPPHPGEILEELYLQPLKISIEDAAVALNIETTKLESVIKQQADITPELAIRLSHAFSTSSEFWLNMQIKHTLWQANKVVDTSTIKVLS